MGLIDIAFDPIQDLTVVTATGKLKADDFHNSIREYYAGPLTAHILLDFNQADLSAFQSHDLIRIASHSKRLSGAHQVGKTAIVANKPLEYGIGRMFEAYATVERTPFKVETFRSHGDAKKWLGV